MRRRSLITVLTRAVAPALASGLLLASLTGCAGALPGSSDRTSAALESAGPQANVSGAEAEGAASSETRTVAGASVIRTGDIWLTITDTAAAAEQVAEVAEELDGFVESESVSGATATSAQLYIRVPSDRFDEAFERLGELGEVTSQRRSASDVTAQHVDLQARVKALEESVARLSELMRGAATTGELIEAETALSQRQQELDGLRAQLDSLEDQVDRAGISVNLSTETAVPGGPASFWDGLLVGIDSIGKALASGLILFGVALPWIVLLGVIAGIVLLIVWWSARGKRRRKE